MPKSVRSDPETSAPATLNSTTIGPACPKCGITKTLGKRSCCARSGAWFQNCGDAGDANFDHTWAEGIQACKSELLKAEVCTMCYRGYRVIRPGLAHCQIKHFMRVSDSQRWLGVTSILVVLSILAHIVAEVLTPGSESAAKNNDACPKCGAVTKSGKLSCCARGGSWFKNCGDAGDTQFDHTWTEGFQTCKSPLLNSQLCAMEYGGYGWLSHAAYCSRIHNNDLVSHHCRVMFTPTFLLQHTRRRVYPLKTPIRCAPSAAFRRSPISTAAALAAVLGSANAEKSAIQSSIILGPKVSRPATVSRIRLPSNHRWKAYLAVCGLLVTSVTLPNHGIIQDRAKIFLVLMRYFMLVSRTVKAVFCSLNLLFVFMYCLISRLQT